MNSKAKDLNLDEIILIIINRKYFIGITTTILIFLSVIYLLWLPNIYQSSATLMINGSQQSLSKSLSQYSGLASLAGVSLPSDSLQNKPDLVIETIKSKIFFRKILTKNKFLPEIFAAKGYDINSKKIIFNFKLYDSQLKKWVRKPNFLNNVVPSYLEAYEKYISMLEAYEDPKTGFIKISFKHVSPNFSKSMINTIFNELNNSIKTSEIKKAERSIEYLKNELKVTQEKNIKESINMLIEKELTNLMTANVDENYIIQYIDEPFIPERKASPNRKILLVIFASISFILVTLLVLIKEMLLSKNFKNTNL